MASSNDAIWDVITSVSTNTTMVNPNITITNGNTTSKTLPTPLSEEFKSFRAALWARRAELNPAPQPIYHKSSSGVIFKH